MANYFVFSIIYIECHLTSNFAPAYLIPSQTAPAAKLLRQSEKKCWRSAVTADFLEVGGKIAQCDTTAARLVGVEPRITFTILQNTSSVKTAVNKAVGMKATRSLFDTVGILVRHDNSMRTTSSATPDASLAYFLDTCI